MSCTNKLIHLLVFTRAHFGYAMSIDGTVFWSVSQFSLVETWRDHSVWKKPEGEMNYNKSPPQMCPKYQQEL